MINTRNYIVLENRGYQSKTEAYEQIKIWYSHMNGVTTYFDNGLWYIVQSKALM